MAYSNIEQKLLKQVGARLRNLRLEKGLSQENLAFKADLDRTYYSSVERGERNVAFLNLKKICKALDISMSELLIDIR